MHTKEENVSRKDYWGSRMDKGMCQQRIKCLSRKNKGYLSRMDKGMGQQRIKCLSRKNKGYLSGEVCLDSIRRILL